LSQGHEKTSLGSQKDPISAISSGVQKGIWSLVITAVVLLPIALFYEQIPEAIRLFATPNMLVFLGICIVALAYYLVGKFANYLRKQKVEGRHA